MASIASVKALVLRLNHIMYCDQPREMHIPCEGSDVVAVEYWNPNVCDGVMHPTACYTPSQDPAVAQADTIKTLRVRNYNDNNTYWVIIDMADDESKFADNCNACCGPTPDMTTGIVIPPPIIEDSGVVDAATGISTFQFPVPVNAYAGTDYLIAALSYNGGIKPAAVPLAVGYATISDVVVWLNTNANVMGVWSAINSDKVVKLVGATGVSTVALDLSLEEGKYCLDIPAVAVNVAVLTLRDPANNLVDIPITPLVLSEANKDAVLTEMKKHLVGTLGLVNLGAPNWKMNYAGLMRPYALRSADLTTVSVLYTVGVCV